MEVLLSTFGNSWTCQVCISTAILVYFDRVSEVVLLIDDDLVIEMRSALGRGLWKLWAHDLLA